MAGSDYYAASIQLASVVIPVAVYFLALGVFNSRRRPQLLSGRQDFALLIAALSPLLVVPALGYFGLSLGTLAAAVAAVAGAILVLAPRGASWVIYNMPLAEARSAVAEALAGLGLVSTPTPEGFHLPAENASVAVRGFAPLRNVSIRLRGGQRGLDRRFEEALARTVGRCTAQTSPMAVALLLVATAMLVAPMAVVAHRVPEIVRILTDLLY